MMPGFVPHISQFCIGLILLTSFVFGASKDMKQYCKLCKSITDAYKEKLDKTAKSNFGGGNTRWEEKSLGSYATSETRFLEIQESMCSKSGDDKKCHHVLEENEELLEHYWFKVFKMNQEADLYQWLCVDEKLSGGVAEHSSSSLYAPVCCPQGRFGPDCKDCTGGPDKPCSGHGKCDGEATKGGTGKCLCDTGYQGDECKQCKEGFYGDQMADGDDADKNELECKSCHISCKLCTGGNPADCTECRVGYQKNAANETHVCEDINECEDQKLCKKGKFCSNTVGSYVCMACDPACDECLGVGADKCIKCRKGFHMDGNKCVDINECKNKDLCNKQNMYCLNVPGSHKCECKGNHELVAGECRMRPPDPDPKSKKKRGISSEEMFKNVSPYTMPIFFSTIGLFAATGHFLRGHMIGSLLLITAMSLTLYRVAAKFG